MPLDENEIKKRDFNNNIILYGEYLTMKVINIFHEVPGLMEEIERELNDDPDFPDEPPNALDEMLFLLNLITSR